MQAAWDNQPASASSRTERYAHYYVHYYVDDLYSRPYISLPHGTGVMSAQSVTLKRDVHVFALRMHLNKSVTCFPCEREPVETQWFL